MHGALNRTPAGTFCAAAFVRAVKTAWRPNLAGIEQVLAMSRGGMSSAAIAVEIGADPMTFPAWFRKIRFALAKRPHALASMKFIADLQKFETPRVIPRTPSIGSSPHARGTRRRFSGRLQRKRFIPACAGNAEHRRKNRERIKVHPRMRGERLEKHNDGLATLGSSPHARGTRPCRTAVR
jgi:hypothetical protein